MKTTNSNNQFTPGPWAIAHYGKPTKWLSIKYGAETIARIEATDCSLDAEGKANARLIAASPDLLAALQGFIDAYGSDVCNCCDSHTPHHCPCCIARAAIAKATKGE